MSETVRGQLLALGAGSPERFQAMPLGLDLDRSVGCEARRGELGAELGLADATPRVGIVARPVAIKAPEVFLDAAERLARGHPACGLLVVGDRGRRPELERLTARLGLADRLPLFGWRPDLDRVDAALDVVVLCSGNEGSPVSLIEAMAASRPVVATRVGSVADLVEDGVSGHLVPSGDGAALAAALGGPARRRALGAAGRKRAVPAFAAERLPEDMVRLYTGLLHEKLPGRRS